MPASLQASGTVFPWLTTTSICRSLETICSGVNVFFGIFRFLSVFQSLFSTGTEIPGQANPDAIPSKLVGDDDHDIGLGRAAGILPRQSGSGQHRWSTGD